jgi:hypothetical protein
MFKKIIFSSLIFLLFSSPSFAFVTSDIINNSIPADMKGYNYDFDVLLMDFIIPDNTGNPDVLRSLTVYNTRSANDTDISKISLWSDNGDNLWQGYMIDNKITNAVKIDSRRWAFLNLNTVIPVGGLHVYISAETDVDITTDQRMQFAIDKLIDANSNGAYESGDAGLFVESYNDGPVNGSFISNFVYSLENRTGDMLPPKVAISNIKTGDIFEISDKFLVSGFAKDRMRGETNSLRISLTPVESNPVWNDVNSLSAYFATWDYTFSNLTVGDYNLQTFALDGYGNSVISEAITIKFIESIIKSEEPIAPAEPKTPIVPEEKQKPANINDGNLVRATGDHKVYVINGNYKRWIQSPEIFNYYGHFNFSIVKEISKNDLEYYVESWLVRVDEDEKVFEINGDGTKHWINMTAEQFTESGRKWDMVYIINQQERNFYETGASVTK